MQRCNYVIGEQRPPDFWWEAKKVISPNCARVCLPIMRWNLKWYLCSNNISIHVLIQRTILFQIDFWIFIRLINSKLASLYLIMNITCCLRPLRICFLNLQTSTLTILDHPINSDLNFPVPPSKNYLCVVKVHLCSLLYHHPLLL